VFPFSHLSIFVVILVVFVCNLIRVLIRYLCSVRLFFNLSGVACFVISDLVFPSFRREYGVFVTDITRVLGYETLLEGNSALLIILCVFFCVHYIVDILERP